MITHIFPTLDVVYPTKVRIFQQITTMISHLLIMIRMLFTLQRYEFFSKSQRNFKVPYMLERCCLPYKGTNFSANHNRLSQNYMRVKDVVYPTKVRIFQQITTWRRCVWDPAWMLFTLQRYEFFSKSQLDTIILTSKVWCCLPYKGTNFSANHNKVVVTLLLP